MIRKALALFQPQNVQIGSPFWTLPQAELSHVKRGQGMCQWQILFLKQQCQNISPSPCSYLVLRAGFRDCRSCSSKETWPWIQCACRTRHLNLPALMCTSTCIGGCKHSHHVCVRDPSQATGLLTKSHSLMARDSEILYNCIMLCYIYYVYFGWIVSKLPVKRRSCQVAVDQ